jgi:hypothetical protein
MDHNTQVLSAALKSTPLEIKSQIPGVTHHYLTLPAAALQTWL